MRRHLDGHVVDLPDFRLGLHPGSAGHLVRQIHREVIPLSEGTRPRDGCVVPTYYTKLESSVQQLQTATTKRKKISIYINININI